MSSLTVVVTGTYISPFSASDTYSVLHGGYLLDPMAFPLSFFYSASVFGGEISTIFTEYLSGGKTEISYDDLQENELTIEGHYVFCNSEVIFDFSNFDQSESKIVKVVFDPNNNDEIQTYNSYISSNQTFYPVLNNIRALYYPSEKFYTYFNPKFLIQYDDGKNITIIVPLTSIQCGIFDSYKDKAIVEALPFYKKPSNVLAFINDNENDELILTNISTSLPFELEENIPFSTESVLAAPIGNGLFEEIQVANNIIPQITQIPQVPLPPINDNPVIPPFPTPTPTPIYGQGIVTLVDKKQIKTIQGIDVYPLDDIIGGIISFEDVQMYSFANEELYPFDGDEEVLKTFVSFENITMFGGNNILFFE